MEGGSRSHAKNENKIQTSGHRGSVDNIEKLGFKIMKLGMVVPCRGKKIGRIGTNFGISFLQIGASLKKARGSERERVTFECEAIYAAPLEFIYRGKIELHEFPVKFWNIPGSFGLFIH